MTIRSVPKASEYTVWDVGGGGGGVQFNVRMPPDSESNSYLCHRAHALYSDDCPLPCFVLKVFDVDCGGGKDWRPWLEQVKMSDQIFLAKVSAHDMAYIFTTSGTWGFHKLVARTHEQFIAIGQIFHDVMELAPGDVLFNECSMGSLWGSFCTYVATGITRVLVDMTLPPDDPLAFAWHSCNAERCSVAVMLPPQIYSMISKPARWKDKKHKPRNIVTGK